MPPDRPCFSTVFASEIRPSSTAPSGCIRMAEMRGLSSEARLTGWHDQSAQLLADMRISLTHHRTRVAGKSPLGEALAYIAKYWDGLKLFLTDGHIEIDNNSVERIIRPIALNRKTILFAGHDAGADNWAIIASLIETCKLNAVDPFAYLTATRSLPSLTTIGRAKASALKSIESLKKNVPAAAIEDQTTATA